MSFSYLRSAGEGQAPYGTLAGFGFSIRYNSVKVSGNTVYLSSARMENSSETSQVPSNLREVSLAILEYKQSDDLAVPSTGKARLRLADGKVFEMVPDDSVTPNCFLTTASTSARGLPDDCMELQMLRGFRDGYMMKQASDGPSMIRDYYLTAPAVVSAIRAHEDASDIHEWMYRDLVLPSVRYIQRGQNARALDHYAGFCINQIAGGFLEDKIQCERRRSAYV